MTQRSARSDLPHLGAARPRGSRGFALIGDPVSQSVSPDMHSAALSSLGLPLGYETVRVPRKRVCEVFGELLTRFDGLNVTRPLKEAVACLVDELDPAAARAGSVNTVVLEGARSIGHSTDGAGLLAALRRKGVEPRGRAVVAGTGGSARAVAAALHHAGCEVTVAGRNTDAGHRIERDLGVAYSVAPSPEADLFVNATPVDPFPSLDLSGFETVADLVYRPRRTRLLVRAAEAGCATVEGVETLVEQGALSLELWTATAAPVEEMRRAAYVALAEAGSDA